MYRRKRFTVTLTDRIYTTYRTTLIENLIMIVVEFWKNQFLANFKVNAPLVLLVL